MNEQRLQAYAEMFGKLFKASSQEEMQKTLQQYNDLINKDFFDLAQRYAKQLEAEGEEETAAFLVNLLEYIANEKTQEVYLQLIDALSKCAEGEEAQILAANEHLIDAGLLEMIELAATDFDRQQEGGGDWLRNLGQFLTQYIESRQPTQADFEFLFGILETIDNGGEQEQVYSLLRENIDKIDLKLAYALQIRADEILSTLETGVQIAVGDMINKFSVFIQQFPMGNRSYNIEIAITGYQIILDVFTEIAYPNAWAMIQNNLGCAYSGRFRGERAENIEKAISCFKNALRIHTETTYPDEWAMIQNNLAGLYPYRVRGERAENIEKAISCFKNALRIHTETTYPDKWAKIQTNLAVIYKQRIKGEQAENIEKAIYCLKNTLRIYTETAYPHEWAKIQSYMAVVYSNRVSGEWEENIEKAISCFKNALRIYTETAYPHEWADTQINLGNTYRKSIFQKVLSDEEREENIEKAISSYYNALDIHTKIASPHEWAMTQNNLGLAYFRRVSGERKENIEKAISFLKNAVTICTPHTNPSISLEAFRNLGNLYIEEGNWQLAIEAYTTAIEIVEQLRIISLDDYRRQEILDQSIEVYTNIVEAYVNLEQLETALEYAERSRCRRLVDLMESNRRYNDGNIPQEVAEYLKKYGSLQQRIDTERQRSKKDLDSQAKLAGSGAIRGNRASFRAVNKTIALLEAEKQQVWQQIRSFDKVLSEQIQVEHISFNTIRQLIPDEKTALICCYTTSTNLQIFVVYKNKPVRLHTTDLNGGQFAEFAISCWFYPYLEQSTKSNNPQVWLEQMPQTLAKLAQHLKLSTLVQNCLQDIEELIIIPHLYLHSIPFCALPTEYPSWKQENISSPVHLGKLFRLRILPSAQVLQFCYQREDVSWNNQGDKIGTVEDADNSLPFSQYEGKQIAQMYGVPDENRLRGKKATVDNYRQLIKEKDIQILHSSHHASSRLDNPLESQLLLAEGETISLGEIMSPGWRVSQLTDVFLSCCETNLSFSRLSDEPLTLATGFLCAGARSVVSTLWAVDDLATAIFSIIYYKLRKDGKDRPTALQKAQHELKNLSGEKLEQNYYSDLNNYLTTQREQAKNNRKQARKQLKRLLAGTPEYEQAAIDKSDWSKVDDKLFRSQKRLEQIIKESQPFAHPYYWAGFVSQGLR